MLCVCVCVYVCVCDCRSVPHTQRVTGYWLEMCLMLSRLMDPAQLPLLYKPLPFDLPLPAFSGEARLVQPHSHASSLLLSPTTRA